MKISQSDHCLFFKKKGENSEKANKAKFYEVPVFKCEQNVSRDAARKVRDQQKYIGIALVISYLKHPLQCDL